MIFARHAPGRPGPDFVTAWQVWKERNHCPERFVLEYTTAEGVTVVLFRGPDDDSYSWYIEVDEEDLPDGVERDGVTVRDTRVDT